MTRTLQTIERHVNDAFDHLTQAVEPLDRHTQAEAIRRALLCFLGCCLALGAEYERLLEKSEERR